VIFILPKFGSSSAAWPKRIRPAFDLILLQLEINFAIIARQTAPVSPLTPADFSKGSACLAF
jgi:hypothetical protein